MYIFSPIAVGVIALIERLLTEIMHVDFCLCLCVYLCCLFARAY
jgi:hypothetical protein